MGYTAFRTEPASEGRTLRCSRFRFVNREGFYALLGVFQSLAADHRFATFSLPADPALPYLMGEWSLGAASFSLQPAGMVRVVSVAEVLRRAAYRGTGELHLGVRDALIPENDGVFLVRFKNGSAVRVEKRSEAPDAIFSIAAFSALIAGVCDFDGAANWMNGIQIHSPDAPFDSVFYRKSMMISEYF